MPFRRKPSALPDPEDESSLDNLSDIPTIWSIVNAAHRSGDDARAAQDRIVRRYGSAILRYLIVLTRDVEAASDLFQQFAKGLVEGRFHRADPAKGRFRDYVKAILINLHVDHRRELSKSPIQLGDRVPEIGTSDDSVVFESDREFLAIWRAELLKCGLDELAALERRTGRPHHQVLDLRLRHADATTAELANTYAQQIGRSVSDAQMRKLLHNARRAFAEILLKLVEETLDNPGLDEVEAELIELGLLSYCRVAIDRRRSA